MVLFVAHTFLASTQIRREHGLVRKNSWIDLPVFAFGDWHVIDHNEPLLVKYLLCPGGRVYNDFCDEFSSPH